MKSLPSRLYELTRSVGMRHGITMVFALGLAGALDYAVNVLAGRWLVPVSYGVFIAVAALLQITVHLTNAIRNVVAFYSAEASLAPDSYDRVSSVLRRSWRWGWRWGTMATAIMFLGSIPLARLLRLPNSFPLWAATPMAFALFLRTVSDGTLQGTQTFWRLGAVQIIQATVRLVLAAVLMWIGLGAVGAIVALPIACFVALGLACWWLRPWFQARSAGTDRSISWHYSVYTFLGLGAFAVLTNIDALFVKRFFSPAVAGNYGPVVTLTKAVLFIPLAIGMVVLPKSSSLQSQGKDSRPILVVALLAALLPSFALTALYAISPAAVVKSIFAAAYADPGIVLPFASLAATMYAGLYIWLNYALSVERPAFVYALVGVVVTQALGMRFFGRSSLVNMTLVMVVAGVFGNVMGFLTTWFAVPNARPVRIEAAAD